MNYHIMTVVGLRVLPLSTTINVLAIYSMAVVWTIFCLFELKCPSQQLWSCRDSQLTKPHFYCVDLV